MPRPTRKRVSQRSVYQSSQRRRESRQGRVPYVLLQALPELVVRQHQAVPHATGSPPLTQGPPDVRVARERRRSSVPIVVLERLPDDAVWGSATDVLPDVSPPPLSAGSDNATPASGLCRADAVTRQTAATPAVIEGPLHSLSPPLGVLPPRRRHAEVPHRVTYRSAIRANSDIVSVAPHSLGNLSDVCEHCGAKFFEREAANRQGLRRRCCGLGTVVLPPIEACPDVLQRYLTSEDHLAVQFRTYIRAINSNFAMASFKCNIPETRNVGQGHWCFCISGQIYHHTAPLPSTQELREPILNQYYFVDAGEAIDRRAGLLADRVDSVIINDVEDMLRRHNRYVQAYRTMHEVIGEMLLQGESLENMVVAFAEDTRARRQNYNLPESRSDIAAVYCGEDPPYETDLRIYPRTLRHPRHTELKNLNRMTDPMVYPLLFPHGEDGWHPGLRQARGVRGVTIREYYRYRLQIRDAFSPMHHAGKLFQQYIVDAWCKAEGNQLWWYRQNMRKVRQTNPDSVRRLIEARRIRGEVLPVGNITILPTSFLGGPRSLQRHYLDAMTTVSRLGKPDLFITFTCNPKWEEITANLQDRQQWQHRPDLVVRVFAEKLRDFMDDINNRQVYGVVRHSMYVIEFQKRGLPHAHILVCLRPEDKPETVDEIDALISAALPDSHAERELFDLVREFNVHKPCGLQRPTASCMKDGKCSKGYPKPFSTHTLLSGRHLGQPTYRRPDDGSFFLLEGLPIDNSRVVPYNRYALAKYRSHINFEICGSVASIKYLHKYVHKGPDCVTVVSRPESSTLQWDEIRSYLDCRYVSSMEAAWRIFEYRLGDRTHAVMALPVHLPGEQYLQVDEDATDEQLLVELDRDTKLTAYFALNMTDSVARQLKYAEIPEHYTWQNRERTWLPRRQTSKTLGCVVEVSPQNVELFHLRMLLCHVKGAQSFADLKSYGGVTCETYRGSCLVRGLLRTSNEYECALRDACAYKRPVGMRKLFALLLSCEGTAISGKAVELWAQFKQDFLADYVQGGVSENVAEHAALKVLASYLSRICNRTLQECGLPAVDDALLEANALRNVVDEAAADCFTTFQADASMLNSGQRIIFDAVIDAVADAGRNDTPHRSRLFYVDALGGTGKTFLFNTIIKETWSHNHMPSVAVAWTGIAASLLIGGKTSHRTFKIPINLTANSKAGYPLDHDQSRLLRDCLFIVWDEASMAHRYAVEAVDRYLQDLMLSDLPMGGKVVVFGGDFRQTLPVVPKGDRSEIVYCTLKYSPLWKFMQQYTLHENVRTGALQRKFTGWLHELGDGRLPYVNIMTGRQYISAPPDLIEVDRQMLVASKEALISAVFGQDFGDAIDLADRVILSPTNVAAREMNALILQTLQGDEKTYFSVDECGNDERDDFAVPIDYVNSLDVTALPPHELTLKIGAVVMFLINLDIDMGQCNGTRFKVVSMREHLLELEMLTGTHHGERLFLPKLKLQSTDASLPKAITRIQFPIKLAFAITINKSQGQTFGTVGVFLPKPCFAHGQLYVAFSRVRCQNHVFVCIENGSEQGTFNLQGGRKVTRNVVYNTIVDRRTDEEALEAAVDIGDFELDVPTVDGGVSTTTKMCEVRDLLLAARHWDINDDGPAGNDVEDAQMELDRLRIPQLTTQELAARVSVGERAGTSGGCLASRGIQRFSPMQQASDSNDSDTR